MNIHSVNINGRESIYIKSVQPSDVIKIISEYRNMTDSIWITALEGLADLNLEIQYKDKGNMFYIQYGGHAHSGEENFLNINDLNHFILKYFSSKICNIQIQKVAQQGDAPEPASGDLPA